MSAGRRRKAEGGYRPIVDAEPAMELLERLPSPMSLSGTMMLAITETMWSLPPSRELPSARASR
jgi:hypothetical protein